MKRWIEEYRIPLIFTCFIFSFMALASILYTWFGHKMVETMYRGESIELLNRAIVGQKIYPLDYYLKMADEGFANLLLSAGLITLPLGLFSLLLYCATRHKNKTLVNFSILCISFIITLAMAEALVRTYQFFYRAIPFYIPIGKQSYDSGLGWKGKQIFGDPSTQKYKIFLIGDSYTHGSGVEERYIYYNVIRDNLDAEIFAYGGCGYGTLQEYLVLDRYFDEIKPDLIILQVCCNDFINNSLELERASFYNNDLMVRPYLAGGKIEYHFPGFLGKTRVFLAAHSRLFYLIVNRIERICAMLAKKNLLHTVEKDIKEKGTNFDDFKKAVNTTDDLITKIKNRAGKTPIIAFSIDDLQPYCGQFRRIFQNNHIELIEEVPKIIRGQEGRGIKLRIADGSHFNETGHQICGQVLSETLKKTKQIHGKNRK